VGPVSRRLPCFFFLGLGACEGLPPFRWSPFSPFRNRHPRNPRSPTYRSPPQPRRVTCHLPRVTQLPPTRGHTTRSPVHHPARSLLGHGHRHARRAYVTCARACARPLLLACAVARAGLRCWESRESAPPRAWPPPSSSADRGSSSSRWTPPRSIGLSNESIEPRRAGRGGAGRSSNDGRGAGAGRGRGRGGGGEGAGGAGGVRSVGGVRVVPAPPPLPARRPAALRRLVPRPRRE
jgi:hypothetical protein